MECPSAFNQASSATLQRLKCSVMRCLQFFEFFRISALIRMQARGFLFVTGSDFLSRRSRGVYAKHLVPIAIRRPISGIFARTLSRLCSVDATFCVDCLAEALREHGNPEVFNSDQGLRPTK